MEVTTTFLHSLLNSSLLLSLPWSCTCRAGNSAADLRRIEAHEAEITSLTDDELRKHYLSLRYRACCGEPSATLLHESFALTRVAAERALGMRHYGVQIIGALEMQRGRIAEMQTGEGKTLTATLPLLLAALPGRGAHLATANDYLAARDADLMRPLYELLGLTVGVIDSQSAAADRRAAYACDITYGTAKQFGFDFLRDRLAVREQQQEKRDLMGRMLGLATAAASEASMQRSLQFMLVDEADSIMLDEARTPLIVSSLPHDPARLEMLYRWCSEAIECFERDMHFELDRPGRQATLTADGRRLARGLTKPDTLGPVSQHEIYQQLELAAVAVNCFTRDRDYVVREGEVVIVDENTGRLAEGRRWREGVHQSIEAKEQVDISLPTGEAARVTMQSFLLEYEQLAGMTGTTAGAAREFRGIYHLGVSSIPTNRPPQRVELPTVILPTAGQKWSAIVEETIQVHATGRPLLIGTRSIDLSQHLADMLREAGLDPRVLNAHQNADEAETISHAGQRGAITVATNMAGRGADVRLGPGVEELGGLHVICTEMHHAARIDRQLIGRSGRQGDPGSYRFFLSLDDDVLLHGLSAKRIRSLKRRAAKGGSLEGLLPRFHAAQMAIGRKHYQQRKELMHAERDRLERHRALGEDPYLDAAF